MKDLIEMLKQNKRPFGLMPEEMQAKATKIGKADNFEWVNENGEWAMLVVDSTFYAKYTYRLRADYTEPVEDEYELCEIRVSGRSLVYDRYGCNRIIEAPHFKNFAGYLYEDGVMDKESVRYQDANGIELRGVNFETLKLGGIKIIRPYPNGSVVFKKATQ